MPELPDLTVYQESLEQRLMGESLDALRVINPFVLRTVHPGVSVFIGKEFIGCRRIGKQIVLCFESGLFAVIHLMIAGRFQWYALDKKVPQKRALALFKFSSGTLLLTEAGQKRRASLRLIEGEAELSAFDKGGLELDDINFDQFKAALNTENHTIKRTLTDQRFIAGIGNAYSDEILHRARLSPMRQTKHLTNEQWSALFEACRAVVGEWTNRLRNETGSNFPKKVTAFHPKMAVHGKYNQPCPECAKPVQRIRYASNECNYCAKCQNQGKLLADRSLSRLLKQDWPKTLEELDT